MVRGKELAWSTFYCVDTENPCRNPGTSKQQELQRAAIIMPFYLSFYFSLFVHMYFLFSVSVSPLYFLSLSLYFSLSLICHCAPLSSSPLSPFFPFPSVLGVIPNHYAITFVS